MFSRLFFLLALSSISALSFADKQSSDCSALPNFQQLKNSLSTAQQAVNGGFGLHMWATLVDRSGQVCAVTYSGESWKSQWLTARVVSAEKAYTANALGLDDLALATANLYSAVQPGGSLYGLQGSQPVQAQLAYAGPASSWGKPNDPLVGKYLGGLTVFGGGLALYDKSGTLVGGLGVSGDTSCADHAIAWRVRHALALDYVPAGVGPGSVDQIAYDGPWKHPHCQDPAKEDAVIQNLPAVSKKN